MSGYVPNGENHTGAHRKGMPPLGKDPRIPPMPVKRANRSRPPLHPSTSARNRTRAPGRSPKRTVVSLADPLHNLRQIPGGDEASRTAYLAKAEEDRESRVVEEKNAEKKLDPPPKAWPITSFLIFRIPGAAIYLIICAGLAATLYTWSLGWISSDGGFPLFDCPSSSVVSLNENVDGNFCQLTFAFDNITNYRAAAVGFQKEDGSRSTCWIPSRYQYEDCDALEPCYVRCRSAVPCRTALYGPDSKTTPKPNQVEPVACAKTVIWGADENNNIDSGCSQTIWLKEDQPTTVPQTAIAVQPYCDWGGTVSPADIIGIRALFLGVLLFLLTYIGAVFAIRVNYKRRMTTHAAELEMLQPKMNDVREDMHSVVERRWCGLPVEAGPPHDSMNHNGPKFETGSLLELNTAAKPGKPPMTSADHKRRFASGSWRYRLRLMAGLRARKKAMVASRIRHQAVMMGVSYLLLIVSIMCLVLLIQPLNYVDYAPRAFLDPIIHPATRNSGEGVYAWLDLLAFSDYIVEFIVLTIGILTSAYKMKTGNQLGKKEGRPHDLNTASTGVSPPSRDVELGVDSPVRQISDDVEHDPIFPESVCAIVLLPGNGACTWSVDARSNLVRCLTRLIDIGLPARQIFVVDCGSGLTPIDDTWRVIHTVVSPDINYSYLPENNRILGAYWANKIWIPYAGKKAAAASGMKTGSSGVFESKSEGSPNVTFRYALIVDDIETVLPSTFDLRSLNLGESKPAAVHFPVTIDPRNRPTEDLAKFADMRLMLQCAHINLQANLLGGALSTQRGISLWHRGALDKVLYEHGTEPFAVCGIFAGLLMLRQRDEDIIKTAVQLAPETFGNSPYVDVGFQPKDIIEYVAQETEAAAPARFLMLYFRELLWVPSFTHMRSVFFKPFLFFVPILSGILDFLRPLILCSLVFRDPLSLLVMLIVLAIFSWLLALLIMASHRKGSSRIRRAGTAYGLRGFLLHPFFQFINSLTRMAGHFVLLFGSNWQERALTGDENSLRVGLRVDDIRDIPPCPPSTEVDWFSVWAGAGPQGTGDHRHHADREMSED